MIDWQDVLRLESTKMQVKGCEGAARRHTTWELLHLADRCRDFRSLHSQNSPHKRPSNIEVEYTPHRRDSKIVLPGQTESPERLLLHVSSTQTRFMHECNAIDSLQASDFRLLIRYQRALIIRLSFLSAFSFCTASSRGINLPLDWVLGSSRLRMLTDLDSFSWAPTTTKGSAASSARP